MFATLLAFALAAAPSAKTPVPVPAAPGQPSPAASSPPGARSPPQPSHPQRGVAVLDLRTREGVSRDLAQTLSELMVIEVRQLARGQRVFGNEDIKALIGFQQQKSLLGCEDTSCLAELGGALGAQEIITGNLSLLADDYVLVLRRLLVAKAQVIEETTRSVPHSEPARLRAAIHSGVGELFGILPAPLAAVSVPAAAPSRGPRVWPWVLGAGALAAAGASVWGFVQVANFQSFRSASQTPGSQVTLAQAQSSQSSAQVGQVVGIAGAIGAAALATGAVLTW